LHDIHLADQDISLKHVGVGKLHGDSAFQYLVATFDIYHGDEAGKGSGDNGAFTPGIFQSFPGVLHVFFRILQSTLGKGELHLFEGDVFSYFIKGFVSLEQ